MAHKTALQLNSFIKSTDVSQAQIAKKLGVSPGFLSKQKADKRFHVWIDDETGELTGQYFLMKGGKKKTRKQISQRKVALECWRLRA